MRLSRLLLAASLFFLPAQGRAKRLSVICVESVWCDVARQIGGPDITVTSIIRAAGIDPHELSPTPSMAREMQGASLVVINGATYDDWAVPLASGTREKVVAAEAAGWKPGGNPHLFMDFDAVKATAGAIGDALIREGMDRQAAQARLAAFDADVERLRARAAAIGAAHPGAPVAVMEPVGEPLFRVMGLTVVAPGFALAMMQRLDPPAREAAVLETMIDRRAVRFVSVNPVVRAPQIDALVIRARAAGIPVVPIGEILPEGKDWQGWMGAILDSVEAALAGHG